MYVYLYSVYVWNVALLFVQYAMMYQYGQYFYIDGVTDYKLCLATAVALMTFSFTGQQKRHKELRVHIKLCI